MVVVNAADIVIEVPNGWEAEIDPGTGAWDTSRAVGQADLGTRGAQPTELPDGAVRRPVAHLATFPLPPGRGDFGGGAVETMRPGDVFVVLFEHDEEAATTALFAAEGVPGPLRAADFEPAALQREVVGGSAAQRFFHVGDRAFCLYVVLGSHIDRRDSIPVVNSVLASLEIR